MNVFLSLKKKKKKTKDQKVPVSLRFKNLNLFYILLILVFFNILSFIFVAIFLIAFIAHSVTIISFNPPKNISLPYFYGPVLPISSYSYAVYEKGSRSLVLAKNENLRFSPASTTKIMTAIVALDYYPLDKVLQVNKEYLVEGSKMKLVGGEQISVENLLYGMLLPSGNDAAHVLSNNYPGGEQAFINAMNKKAQELKLKNTHYIDPAGYEDDNFSTAFDMVRLAAYALENPELKKIVKTRGYNAYDVTYNIVHRLTNLNQLLSRKEVTGVKTGFTQEAGGVLVTSVEILGKTYVVVVLKSQDRFYDTETIIDQVINNIKFVKFN